MALGSGAAGCIKDKPLTQAVILLRPIEHHPDQCLLVFGLENGLDVGQRDFFRLAAPHGQLLLIACFGHSHSHHYSMLGTTESMRCDLWLDWTMS
jgi:hypothetical protein